MAYKNFDEKITSKYGVVIEGWPLAKFRGPGDISSKVELRVLYQAWESDAARFRRMSDEEFKQWDAARFDQALAITTGNHDGTPQDDTQGNTFEPSSADAITPSTTPGDLTSPLMASPPSSQVATPTAPSAAVPQVVPVIFHNISVVTSSDGTPLGITQKPRKPRCDAGSTRGPYRKAAPSDPPAASTSRRKGTGKRRRLNGEQSNGGA